MHDKHHHHDPDSDRPPQKRESVRDSVVMSWKTRGTTSEEKAWQWGHGWHVFTVWHGRLIGPPLQELQMAIGAKGGPGSVATIGEEGSGSERDKKQDALSPQEASMGRRKARHIGSLSLTLSLLISRSLDLSLSAT